ncbi:MAG: EAL domain-containing protein [Chromatiales bacterium]|nr:EAL domain-containing protein [Chromatiales bacterium]
MSERIPPIVYVSQVTAPFQWLFVSDNASELLGIEPAICSEGKMLWDKHIHSQDIPSVIEAYQQAKDNQPISIEYRVKGNSGESVLLKDEIRILSDNKGERTKLVGQLRPANQQLNTQEALRISEASLQKAQAIAHLGSWYWDITSGLLTWSDETFRIFGSTPQAFEPTYQLFLSAVHPEDRQSVEKAVAAAVKENVDYCIIHRIILPEGEIRTVRELGDVERDAQGVPQSMTGTVQDITDQKRLEEKLREAAVVFENTSEAVIITDSEQRIINVNGSFTRITGYTPEEVLNRKPQLLRSGKHDQQFYASLWASVTSAGFWQGEIWNRRKDGELFATWQNITAVTDQDGSIIQYISIFSDITDRKLAEDRLHHLAHFDMLTTLPNRLLYNDRLTHALQRAHRHQENVGLLFIDLDGFKHINDSFGHQTGDHILQAVAKRLSTLVREDDTVARLGGDEFTVILEDLQEIEDTSFAAERIIDAFNEPFDIDGQSFLVTASIGISIYPQDGEDIESLNKNADAAMYRAKAEGRNNYQFYTRSLTSDAYERIQLTTALHHAVENNELVMFYQPQVNLRDNKIMGFEALIRWQHPTKGLIAPDKFIPLAEETGLIVPIGEWVLRESCRQAQAWRQQGHQQLQIAVNISAVQLRRENFVDSVKSTLIDTGLPASVLELELTESTIMEHIAQFAESMAQLQSLGVALAIDDFGTGYSSLNYLKRLPINTLKIDREFIWGIPNDQNDTAITEAVAVLGNALKLKVIAEGVETKRQQDMLISMGVTTGQGYFFGKPHPATHWNNLLGLNADFSNS